MRSIVVCQTHIGPLEVGMYPSAYYDEAIKQGWQVTDHPLFSYGGWEVWICPECVKWLAEWPLKKRGLFFIWQLESVFIRDGALSLGE